MLALQRSSWTPVASRLCITSSFRWHSTGLKSNFECKKALIISKLSRYEFERYRQPSLTVAQLEEALRRRGSDYDALLYHHQIHKSSEAAVECTLNSKGIETRTVNRLDFKDSLVEWADAIFTAGGDGTFLLAATRVQDNVKPVIGFNSDPTRSEGFLCLPRHYSDNISGAVDKLCKGQFDWNFRSRIRITLVGDHIFDPPIELHDQQLLHPEYRFFDCLQEQHKSATEETSEELENEKQRRVLPVLALNEVFMGERLSARVSYYEVKVNGGRSVKIKSSGLCAATGTGSTSWTFSIGRLGDQSIAQVLQALKTEMPSLPELQEQELVQRVTNRYNHSLVFAPDESRMAYVVRDMICASVWPMPKGVVEPRGFANKLEVKSRCGDAALVVDGGVSYNFNDGTVAILELYPKDALRTVTLHEN
ncbi:hypothetical protein B566_EDAN008071 [Ephemera danica]|nr:hypothetical protein B566_EDAN008071 [Ephemera danica]